MKDPLAAFPGYVLKRASAATLSELNRRLAPLDLRHGDAAFLLLIEALPGANQSEVGRILDIERANMVPLVARLDARGWIERRKVDGRSSGLFLTSAGRAGLAKTRAVVEKYEAELIRRVPAKLRPAVLPILLALWNRPNSNPPSRTP